MLTHSIRKTSEYYIQAGFISSEIFFFAYNEVNICFLNKKGHPCIELIEPASETSPVFKTLQKTGVAPVHFCYEVDDITMAIQQLKERKFLPISNPVPATAIDNRLICFLYNKDTGLIELIQK